MWAAARTCSAETTLDAPVRDGSSRWMPIDCPRCHVTMLVRTAAVRPEAAAITADLCPQCQGLWFDGVELGEVSAALGGLPHRKDEIAREGAGSAIGCPRCKGAMREVALLDVAIDVCGDCSGVWLDGSEYESLSRAADQEEGLSPPPPARDLRAAAKAQRDKQIRCAKCQSTAPLDRTYMTEKGLICADCYVGGEREAMDQRAHQGDPAFASYVRAPSPYQVGQAEEHARAANAAFGILGVLLGSGRCSRCGCRNGSHCSH